MVDEVFDSSSTSVTPPPRSVGERKNCQALISICLSREVSLSRFMDGGGCVITRRHYGIDEEASSDALNIFLLAGFQLRGSRRLHWRVQVSVPNQGADIWGVVRPSRKRDSDDDHRTARTSDACTANADGSAVYARSTSDARDGSIRGIKPCRVRLPLHRKFAARNEAVGLCPDSSTKEYLRR